MDPTDPETWQQYNHRPAWVRRHREALMDATGLEIPQDLAAVDDWLDRYKAHMTRKLRNDHDHDTAEESTDNGGET